MPSIEVTDANFVEAVVESSLPVIIDFFSVTCGPCRQFKPIFERLSDEYKDKYKFVIINVANAQSVSQRYGIRAVPTIVIMEGGIPTHTQVGFPGESKFREMLDGKL